MGQITDLSEPLVLPLDLLIPISSCLSPHAASSLRLLSRTTNDILTPTHLASIAAHYLLHAYTRPHALARMYRFYPKLKRHPRYANLVTKSLIRLGADPTAGAEELTPAYPFRRTLEPRRGVGVVGTCLLLAAKYGHVDVVGTLLDAELMAQGELHQQQQQQQQPSSVGLGVGGPAIGSKGVAVEGNGKDHHFAALAIATMHGHTDTVKMLLRSGAPMWVQGVNGGDQGTLLVIASQIGHSGVVGAFLDFWGGSSADATEAAVAGGSADDGDSGERTAQHARQRFLQEHHHRALQIASAEGHTPVVLHLLHRAPAGSRFILATLAFRSAAERNQSHVIASLLAESGDDMKRASFNVIKEALGRGDEQTVGAMVAGGAEYPGWMALMEYVRRGDFSLIPAWFV
ncbi:hypothetical protein HK104_009083 [Borealophlyctis nickersoniae]|nr:hypothetical protein HK104_009083 [Borealophlyctis nickersoniae]